MSDLVESIVGVSKAWQRRRVVGAELRDDSALIESIRTVANTGLPVKKAEPVVDRTEIYRGIRDVSAACVRRFRVAVTLVPKQQTSLLDAIGRGQDENLHSDFLSALLDPQKTGALAIELFARLHRRGNPSVAMRPSAYQITRREVRLDEIMESYAGTDIGARRIDVLVKTRFSILVIENKIGTDESENQTKDYYDAITRRYDPTRWSVSCLLLSPSGMRAQHRAFAGISYCELFLMLRELEVCEMAGPGRYLWELYQEELEHLHISPLQRKLERSAKVLQEAGWHV